MESVFIEFGQTPIIDLGEDFSTCFDTVVSLDASPSNVDPSLTTYQWFQDGIELGDTTPTLEIVEIGTYEVIVNFEGCVATDSIVIGSETLVVSLPEGFRTCPDELQTIMASTDETGVNYQWFLNGDQITGETNASLDINVSPEAFGDQVYEVQITRGVCMGTAQIVITLYDVDNCTITQGISPSNLDGLNDSLDLTFLADRTGIENVQIFNRHGRLVFEQSNYVDQWRGQTNEDVDLPTGTYFYVINFSGEDPEYGRQSTGWIYLNQE
jgi:gliding motility-associated-like protein